ncbi:hypothetical protein IC235_11195 [Hymenobacter sp. BT664]|uniref:Uncharacterized protein n=1 Tax=Hymenobacter montanus TaxID=2771359 RepID=A0A927BCV2_9BACT|nr:hypothetical protein [Hymenobacter montanus]MBD2768455.1 hypothetical protein [Hymenobacter montanus]
MPFMLFSSNKIGHVGQILSGGFLGEVVVNNLTPPTPNQVQAWGAVIIQLLVGVVTIWATIRKALQQPQAVVQVPADVVPVISAAVVPTGSVISPVSVPAADGSAQ